MKIIPRIIAVFLILSSALGGGEKSRLAKPITYNGYFPWTPPETREDWARRKQQVREQVLVANGLWPMPAKIPLKPVIHGKIEREGYTIEKVFFASYPGFYVTGNLYRPTAPPAKGGKYPAILSPHGHWANGRFFEAGEKQAKDQIKQGAEKTMEGARYPLQARCVQLARMGCIVFHYDMVGYADSKQIAHRSGFTDPEAELRLQNFMGLQTFNSIRALDFLISLPDVDASRIGVTGASGGGTQTFILCAIDDRPAAAFPAVMVSTAMQGGCICENCSYLRIGTGNIELAALFAPKPLGMSGANDWTIEIETKGLPQLQELYKLLGATDNVMAKTFSKFGHNYNQVSREVMYNFFNKHLHLGLKEPVTEKPFVPVPPRELSVFDSGNPLPKDAVDVYGLRKYLTRESDRQLHDLFPKTPEKLAALRKMVGTALRVMITDTLPGPGETADTFNARGQVKDGVTFYHFNIGRKGSEERVEATFLEKGGKFSGREVVVWVHPDGLASLKDNQGNLAPDARQILDKGKAILAVEVLGTGSKQTFPPVDKNFAGYTFGYNRPPLAGRVHDILTAVAVAKNKFQSSKVHLAGFGKAGPWVVLARGLCGNAVTRTAADLDQFRFQSILSMNDEMMLPGALKYGGLPVLTALAAPDELLIHNARGINDGWVKAAYQVAGKAENLAWNEDKLSGEKIFAWLVR